LKLLFEVCRTALYCCENPSISPANRGELAANGPRMVVLGGL
jgi:hypothetical protein